MTLPPQVFFVFCPSASRRCARWQRVPLAGSRAAGTDYCSARMNALTSRSDGSSPARAAARRKARDSAAPSQRPGRRHGLAAGPAEAHSRRRGSSCPCTGDWACRAAECRECHEARCSPGRAAEADSIPPGPEARALHGAWGIGAWEPASPCP